MQTPDSISGIKQYILLNLLRLGSSGFYPMLYIFPDKEQSERKRIAMEMAGKGLITTQSEGSSTIKITERGYRKAIFSYNQIQVTGNNLNDVESIILISLLELSLNYKWTLEGTIRAIPDGLIYNAVNRLIAEDLITIENNLSIQLTRKGFMKAISYEIAEAEKL